MIKQWYKEAFPTDDLGDWLNDGITFQGLFVALDSYKDIYEYIGVGDSVVRERIFSELAKRIDAPYSYVYEQWLKSA
jgi:tRNA nucleotidyltransferase/poly(A) polymerase